MDNFLQKYLNPIYQGLTTPSPTGAGGLQGLAETYSFSPPMTGGPELHGLLGLLGMVGKMKNVQTPFKDLPRCPQTLTRVGDEFMDLGATGVLRNTPKTAEPLINTLKTGFRKIKHPFTEFVSKEGKPTTLPIDEFNGPTARIFPTQNTVEKSGVREWMKRIQEGDKSPVVIDFRKRFNQWRVVDGHTKLKAYENLGIKNIPVIDNTGGKFTQPSLLDYLLGKR